MGKRHIYFIKKKNIIDSYNSSFEHYNDRYELIQLQKYELVFKGVNFQSKLILDAGCGTGLLYTYLTKQFSKSKYYRSNFICLDISINMLNEIKITEEFKEKRAYINLILSDMENLPFRDNFFDLIVSITSLQNLPDIFQGVSELIRICKQGSEFYLTILKKDTRLNELISKNIPYFDDFKIIDNEESEDAVILGKLI